MATQRPDEDPGRGTDPPKRSAAPAGPSGQAPEPPVGDWQPVSSRSRWLLALLAAAMALGVAWMMLQPKLRLMAARQARGEAPVPIGLPTDAHRAAQASAGVVPPDRPACEAGSVNPRPGCVGGRMPVLVLPAPPASPRP